jgi:trans-aconitate 2-methyltransferase
LKNFHELLTDRGVMAIQIPLFWDMPVGKAIRAVSSESHWQKMTEGVEQLFEIRDPSYYYDVLAQLFSTVDMWKTSYMHVLDSHQAILDMIRSTGLKPYYEKIGNEKEIAEFEQEVFIDMQVDYPLQQDGKVLFPFERLFFIGYK